MFSDHTELDEKPKNRKIFEKFSKVWKLIIFLYIPLGQSKKKSQNHLTRWNKNTTCYNLRNEIVIGMEFIVLSSYIRKANGLNEWFKLLP